MKKMKSILMVVSFSTLLFAAGSGSNGNQSDGAAKGKVIGTVEDVMRQDSMLVIKHENQNMLDTVKVTEKTKMDTSLDQLKKGDRVDVEYMTKDDQKVAKSIMMNSSNGNDGSKEKDQKRDSSGNQSDTMQY
ncbi:MAG TPA: hypothetical protein VHO70_23970 [Chitinispirillaceae bacterium]|nr:hypothetical protein [Chitinispirillaceae bacterium]